MKKAIKKTVNKPVIKLTKSEIALMQVDKGIEDLNGVMLEFALNDTTNSPICEGFVSGIENLLEVVTNQHRQHKELYKARKLNRSLQTQIRELKNK